MQAYMSVKSDVAKAKQAPCETLMHGDRPMNILRRLFSTHNVSTATRIARDRLAKTMPGQTGAVAAARLGGFA
ncbi:unnamed protein product [Laminaria digitata]